MKTNFVSMMLLVGLTSLPVWSSVESTPGNGVGNGGDAVVCYTSPTREVISSVELFDYWEMTRALPTSGGISLGAANLTVAEKIQIALDRLNDFDPELGLAIEKIATPIYSNINNYLVSAYTLPDIVDANPRALPQGNCFVEQYAVQWSSPVNGQRRFAISQSFYNSANNNHKAGIILHEALYQYAIKNAGHANSDGTRYLNYVIASELLTGKTYDDYIEYYDQAGFGAKGCKLQYSNEIKRNVYGIKHTRSMPPRYEDGIELCASFKHVQPKLEIVPFRGAIVFTQEGTLQSGKHYFSKRIKGGYFLISHQNIDNTWDHAQPTKSFTQFTFNELGNIITMNLSLKLVDANGDDLDFHLKYGALSILCDVDVSPYDQIIFPIRSNGDLKSCKIKDAATFSYNGKVFTAVAKSTLKFDENGLLVTVQVDEYFSLKVPGINQYVSVKGVIVFTENFEVRWGEELETPITKTLHGKTFTITKADFNEFGEIKLPEYESFTFDGYSDVRYLGKRVLAWRLDSGNYLCRAIDPIFHYQDVTKKEEFFIAGEEKFFNPQTRMMETKIDEYVEVVTEITCSAKTYYVPL